MKHIIRDWISYYFESRETKESWLCQTPIIVTDDKEYAQKEINNWFNEKKYLSLK